MAGHDENTAAGKTIICTYPKPEPDDFTPRLEHAGAAVLYLPAIRIEAAPFRLQHELSAYRWLVFTSKNGIRHFAELPHRTAKNQIAVLGEATAGELRSLGIEPDFVGSGQSGRDLAAELLAVIEPGEQVLLVLGELAPDTISKALAETNPVERINVYRTVAPESWNPEIFDRVKAGNYDLMIVSSPSAIKNLYLAYQPFEIDWKVVSIGKTTTSACRELGIEPVETAAEPSYRGLAETTLKYLQHSKK